jgi:MTH538 TIR-like domain (DUF1863)
VYNGLQTKLIQDIQHPFGGVRTLNLQVTYALSRFENSGGNGGILAATPLSADQDYGVGALDNAKPNRYYGPSVLDRTHQLSFGGYADLPLGFQLSVVSHFWSPLSTSLEEAVARNRFRRIGSMSYVNRFGANPFLAPVPVRLPKRNVFISTFHGDRGEVDAFIYRWATQERVFTPKALCTFDNDDFIDSDNTEYVMSEIRRKYLGDASVTILLVGKCTHSRRYVNWELKSSLRRGQSLPNGLLAYVLPSAMPQINPLLNWDQQAWPHVPERLAANWNYHAPQSCYARYYVMSDSSTVLTQHIEDAFADRTNRADLIKNDSDMMRYNARCKVCGITHT